MFRKMTALVLMLLSLFGMCSCSATPAPVDDAVIRCDIDCQDYTVYNAGMTLTDVRIVKRQTDAGRRSDIVWADFTAENGQSRYSASCRLSYGLYNEGWLLDSYEVLSESMEYINGLDPAVALARANELMDQYYAMFGDREKGAIELVNMNMQGDRCVCLFDHAESMGESGLLVLHWRFRIQFVLDERGWSSGAWDGTMNEYGYDWDLLGRWTGSNGGENFELNVLSYDPEEMTVDVEYAFGSRRSNGVETLYIVNQDFWDQEQREWSLNEDEYAHHGFVDLYPYGKTYTDAGEGSGILADSGNIHCWLQRAE